MTPPIGALLSDLVRRGLIGGVKGYRLLLSPWLGSSCRFTPSCSLYSIEALERHGALRGSYLTVARLARCHPWCEGGIDEVPGDACRSGPDVTPRAEGGPAAPSARLFSRLLSPSSQKTLHE